MGGVRTAAEGSAAVSARCGRGAARLAEAAEGGGHLEDRADSAGQCLHWRLLVDFRVSVHALRYGSAPSQTVPSHPWSLE
jgi:hypothetical protein